ncbi:MAG: NADPH-dependent F420 reductase [Myxococcota bacterium]
MKIAIFGFGNVGQRLAQLFIKAGHSVIICTQKNAPQPSPFATATFVEGAEQADVVALAIPFTAAVDILKPLAAPLVGKIVLDCTNPLQADWSPLLLGQENSAAEELARVVPGASVVKAFNTIFADMMVEEYQVWDGVRTSAFVASDDPVARNTILRLAEELGFAPVEVGPLKMARYLEALAHLNIQLAVAQRGGTRAAFLYRRVNV